MRKSKGEAMIKKRKLDIRQLEAIIACNQSDGYLKQAAKDNLQKITHHRKLAHVKRPGIVLA